MNNCIDNMKKILQKPAWEIVPSDRIYFNVNEWYLLTLFNYHILSTY
jgi:hypothetical protein